MTFDDFWKLYPRKAGKGAARVAWGRKGIDNSRLIQGRIALALAWQITSDQWRKQNGTFIPYPATWLNQERWDDEQPRRPDQEAAPPQERGAECRRHTCAYCGDRTGPFQSIRSPGSTGKVICLGGCPDVTPQPPGPEAA